MPVLTVEERAMKIAGTGCALAVALILGGCHSSEPQTPASMAHCRHGAGDDVEMGAKVAGQSVEGGVETGWAGVKQAGSATGGLFTGGTKGAEEKWNEGKAETKQEGRELKGEVKQEVLPPCPD